MGLGRSRVDRGIPPYGLRGALNPRARGLTRETAKAGTEERERSRKEIRDPQVISKSGFRGCTGGRKRLRGAFT